jgi:hypothetical protein
VPRPWGEASSRARNASGEEIRASRVARDAQNRVIEPVPALVRGPQARALEPPVRARGPREPEQNRLVPVLALPARVQVSPAWVPVPPAPEQRVLEPARLEPEPTRPGLRGWTLQVPRAAGCRCPCSCLQPTR